LFDILHEKFGLIAIEEKRGIQVKKSDYLKDLLKCELCEHRCGVNRLAGEAGVCRVTLPTVASAALHPAPPESYTVFMAGCNYKCLNCQNWTISQYPDNGYDQRGYEDPDKLAAECVNQLNSASAGLMGADRIFFSGGEPTVHLPYIEAVVSAARKLKPDAKINYDTNGYMTEQSLKRVLSFTTSITYDLKAYHNEVHRALTGVPSQPVLRNAEYIARNAFEKLWEYRIVVIPEINESEIRPLTEFIADIDPLLRVCFLAFRPNFALENHKGAGRGLMRRCVEIARQCGLKNAYWSGFTGLTGKVIKSADKIRKNYLSECAQIAGSYAYYAGCQTHPRDCSTCSTNQACMVKRYIPLKIT
jgi:pyruvate formate lyase activating enzyme